MIIQSCRGEWGVYAAEPFGKRQRPSVRRCANGPALRERSCIVCPRWTHPRNDNRRTKSLERYTAAPRLVPQKANLVTCDDPRGHGTTGTDVMRWMHARSLTNSVVMRMRTADTR
jgi:hypothetical protein